MPTELKACPFCDGPAGFDKVKIANKSYWTPACHNTETDCVAYRLQATFNTKTEAAAAWNKRGKKTKRSPDAEIRVKNPVRCFNCAGWTNFRTARLIKHEEGISAVCGQFLCKMKAEECDAKYGKPLSGIIDWGKVTVEDVEADEASIVGVDRHAIEG